MPESLTMSNRSESPTGTKPTMRTLVLTLAILILSGAMAHAQTDPKPQDAGSAPAPADTVTTPDPDKKLVQDRWGTSTGTTAKKPTKKGKPEKTETPGPSNAPQ